MDNWAAKSDAPTRGANQRSAVGGPAVCSFLRQLMAFGRVMRIYASGHRRIEENMRQLNMVADDLLYGKPDGVEFTVRSTGLRVDGNTVHQEPAVVEAFTEVLRVRGIRIMVLRSGLSAEELNLLADLLSQDARDLRAKGGTDAKLSEELHPHFDLLAAATTFGEGGPPEEDRPGLIAATGEAAQQHFEQVLGDQSVQIPEGLVPDAGEAPAELPPEPAPQEVRLVYTAVDNDEFGARSPHLLAMAQETLVREARKHDVHRVAAMVLTDMVGKSIDELEYRMRRDLLCNVVKERRLDVTALRIAQLHLAGDLPDWPFESPAALLLELGAIANDLELLEGAMGRCDMPKSDARSVAEQLATRADAFDLLTVLLRAPLPDNIRVPIEDVLVSRIKRDQREFRQWALENLQRFLHRTSFKFLLHEVDFALGPIVKELLQEDGGKDRERVIEMLVENGSEKALRLLVMGMRYAGEVRDSYLIQAFGRFKHPLAVAVLREIVHRCNTVRCSGEEVACAVEALAKAGTDDAFEFLDEIANKRAGFLPLYRRTIRNLAQEAILVA